MESNNKYLYVNLNTWYEVFSDCKLDIFCKITEYNNH